MNDRFEEIKTKKEEWEEGPCKKALAKFSYLRSLPSRFYTPLDLKEFDFLEKVGFPGSFPFTAGPYPFDPSAGSAKRVSMASQDSGLTRAAMYSGYGAAEDTRDYYKQMIGRGVKQGPNLAFDLPTSADMIRTTLWSREK